MKRHPSLHSLSEQHHAGLAAARDLRLAAGGRKPLAESVAAFARAWMEEIQPHFRAEEEVLLPAFATGVSPDHPLIVRTLTEHVALRRDAAAITQSEGAELVRLAGTLGRALEAHIRFEERQLFPAIEEALEGGALEGLKDHLPPRLQSCRIGYAGGERKAESGR